MLARFGVLDHVVLSTEIDLLLSALEVDGALTDVGAGIRTGSVGLTHDVSKSPVPGFDFALALPSPGITIPVKLKLEPAATPTAFKLWLQLADEQHALVVFKFAKAVPGFALTGARKVVAPDGSVGLEPLPAGDPKHEPILVSRSTEAGAELGPALLVSGSETTPAVIRFTPDSDSTEGVIALGLEPSTVVFGTSSIGFDCPALILDDSETAKGPGSGAPALDPPKDAIEADTLSWRGLLARELDFYLPGDLPVFGGQPIKGFLQIPRGAGGAELIVETKVPARPKTPEHPSRPGYRARIECLDPTASGLSGLVPTLISAAMELPLDGAVATFKEDSGTDRALTFAAGKPVRATATLSRDPVNLPGEFKAVVGVASQGQDGLLSVASHEMGGAKIFNTAAALASALIADKDIERKANVGDTQGVVLYTLLAAGAALSSLFTDESTFVLHGAEIESSGHGAPVGGPIVLTIDYSVAVRVTKVDVGVLSVSMNPDQPMRIRMRKARMSVDPSKSGLSMIGLDFDRASMEVEDPGAWNVGGLESLFDVLGSRSGRGSSWIEVDLGFRLNLGPVRVSGATIRATLTDSGGVEASIRGLEAGVDIPGAIEGTGSLRLLSDPDGFAADMRANVVPLNLAADAGVVYQPPLVLLRLDVDLPAPIPLANTGFGLLGIGGLVGFSARPDYEHVPGASDPVGRQLKWEPKDAGSFAVAPGQSSFGLAAAVGTLPDLGFLFSAKAGLLITAPDLAIRGSLNGRVLQPAVKMSDPSWPPPPGVSFVGFVGVDSTALSFGVLGEVNLKPLLDVRIPLAGHFPFEGETADWYIYLGADGAPLEGRGIGPISAQVLPDILGIGADAYFMVRGHGITKWPHGREKLSVSSGFIAAFGFSLQSTFGLKPVVWAELYASLDLLLASKPPTLAGFGQAGGSLNLGPFSLGVQAQVMFMVAEATQYFWAEVSGRIELFFFDIEGKVTISFGDNEPALKLLPPDRHPLDRVNEAGVRLGSLAVVTDDSYRIVAELVEDWTQAKTVWPDSLVALPFAVSPDINQASAGAQFPAVKGPGAIPPPARLGTEMLHYNWRLESVRLADVTDEPDKVAGIGTPPSGQLSARWQTPRTGAGGTDVSELVLFSTGPDLWVNRLADGGAALPGGDPLEQAADVCRATVPEPGPGWAVGFLAESDTRGFRLPPDPVSADPRASRVEARMSHYGIYHALVTFGTGLFEMPLDSTHWLPEPYTLDPASLVAWPHHDQIERDFEGHIVAPNLHWLDGTDTAALRESGGFLAQAISVTLTEAVVDGDLVLVVDPELAGDRDWLTGLHVQDDTKANWTSFQVHALPTGETALLFSAPSSHPVTRLDVWYPLGVALGVVGIGGVTVGAAAAAQLERTLLAEEAVRLSTAAQEGPPSDPTANAPHKRVILDPERLYRLEIDMTWSGVLSQQNEAGQITPKQTVAFGDQASHVYTARSVPARKQLFFRTAPKADTPPPKEGDRGALLMTWLMTKQDVFKPEMLQRYLGGYDPAQSEQFRFCRDPVRAHFTQDHVSALATAYGFDLQVAVRRVDKAGAEYAEPSYWSPVWSFATDPAYLAPIDRKRYVYALASECSTPSPGSTATVPNPELEPEAWYEVYVHAHSKEPAFKHGALPGVTFKTSRWHDPSDMLAGLGLASGGHDAASVVRGDLVVSAPAALTPPEVVDDDQAFQNALESLGLHAWPPTDEPRLSRLWKAGPGGSFLYAGLLIESPEPINRAGRFAVGNLTLDMGVAGAGIEFGIRRRDRAGARLLFLTATPFAVVTQERVGIGVPLFGRPARFAIGEDDPLNLGGRRSPFRSVTPRLTLNATSTLDGSSAPVTGSLVIPPQPAFASEP